MNHARLRTFILQHIGLNLTVVQCVFVGLLLMTKLLNSLVYFCVKYFISLQKMSASNKHLVLRIIGLQVEMVKV